MNRDFDFGRGERGRKEEGEEEEELRTMAAELKIPPRLSTLSMFYRRHLGLWLTNAVQTANGDSYYRCTFYSNEKIVDLN